MDITAVLCCFSTRYTPRLSSIRYHLCNTEIPYIINLLVYQLHIHSRQPTPVTKAWTNHAACAPCTATRHCYGHWGERWRSSCYSERENEEYYGLISRWLSDNWHWGDPFERKRYKVFTSPNTLLDDASPIPVPKTISTVKLGWVAHSAREEVSIFSVHARQSIWNLTTKSDMQGVVRVAEYRDFDVRNSLNDMHHMSVQPVSGPFNQTPFEIIRIEFHE